MVKKCNPDPNTFPNPMTLSLGLCPKSEKAKSKQMSILEKLSILTLYDQAQVIDSTFYSIYIFQLLKFTCIISSRKQFSGEK